MLRLLLGASAAAICLSGVASAAPVTFFGENLSPGGGVSGAPVTARNSFLASLSGAGTEDFEGVSGSAPLPLNFAGSAGAITATLLGSGTSIVSGGGAGRFATSGGKFVETGAGGDFGVEFSKGISAFGFFGTDLGDFGNGLTLRLTDKSNVESDLVIPLTSGSGGSTDGALHFFGFIDSANAYSSIRFLNIPGDVDVFGFDDMTVGDLGQIVDPPAPVPLPAPAFLLLGGLFGLAGVARRKTRAA